MLRGGLVYAYLASKYGHSLLTQGTFGAVIQHMEPDFVANIPIPNFPIEFQEEIWFVKNCQEKKVNKNRQFMKKPMKFSYIQIKR